MVLPLLIGESVILLRYSLMSFLALTSSISFFLVRYALAPSSLKRRSLDNQKTLYRSTNDTSPQV
jgi:hypothetical protein